MHLYIPRTRRVYEVDWLRFNHRSVQNYEERQREKRGPLSLFCGLDHKQCGSKQYYSRQCSARVPSCGYIRSSTPQKKTRRILFLFGYWFLASSCAAMGCLSDRQNTFTRRNVTSVS
ncbi:unnamed protein product [Ectocarpus sp. 12 AP-2014]